MACPYSLDERQVGTRRGVPLQPRSAVEKMEPNQTDSPIDRSSCEDAAWAHVRGLLCRLSVEVPIPRFTVRKLLDLAPGVVLDTYYQEGSHVPVLVNGEMIGWGEFDVVDDILAIRLTELV